VTEKPPRRVSPAISFARTPPDRRFDPAAAIAFGYDPRARRHGDPKIVRNGFDKNPEAVSGVLFAHAGLQVAVLASQPPGRSRRISLAGLSSRRPTKTVWRKSPSSGQLR
jgi:hypothetical protein